MPSGGSADTRPPNVVFILADDLGWGELGSYGQTKIETPHLDRLARDGMRFLQSYSGAPVCAPSRDVLLTGRHLGHATIRGNRDAVDANGERVEGQHPIPDEVRTLAELFKDHGYVTGAMGKWGLGPVASSGDPNAQGFDHFYGYIGQRVAHSYYPPHLWSDGEKVVINEAPIPGHQTQLEGEVRAEDWQAENYAPDLILDEAVDFLEQHAEERFFLYLPFVEPHVAMQPPTEWVERYPEEWDAEPYRGLAGYTPHPQPRAGYAAMISDLDEHVGLVLAKLEELGLEDDTLVVFTSDNGTTHGSDRDPVFGVGGVDPAFFTSTGGLRGFKGSVYEGGLRVPLLVRWPGRVEAASESRYVTYFADWFPTFQRLLGEAAAPGDGVDLLPVLTGASVLPERTPLVWAFAGYDGQLAVRWGDDKLVRRNVLEGESSSWELYDLSSDPEETEDLAAVEPEKVARGIEILRAEVTGNELFPMTVPQG